MSIMLMFRSLHSFIIFYVDSPQLFLCRQIQEIPLELQALECHQYQEMLVYLGELIRAFYFLVCVCFFHLKEYPQLGQFEVISSLERGCRHPDIQTCPQLVSLHLSLFFGRFNCFRTVLLLHSFLILFFHIWFSPRHIRKSIFTSLLT